MTPRGCLNSGSDSKSQVIKSQLGRNYHRPSFLCGDDMESGKYQLLPPLSQDEYESLKEDVAKMGVLVPIEFDEEGKVLDGHHRIKVCRELGIDEYPRITREFKNEEEKQAHVWAVNIARRQLSSEQLKRIRNEQKKLAIEMRKNGLSQEAVSVLLRVPRRTVRRWEQKDITIGRMANSYNSGESDERPDVRVVIPKKEHSIIFKRYNNGETQEEIAADYKITQPGIVRIIKKEKKKNDEREKRQEAAAKHDSEGYFGGKDGLQNLINSGRKYRIVYADPPWSYDNTMPEYVTAPSDYYQLMTFDEICGMPINKIIEDNAVLFLWVTSPVLEDSFRVINAWGFKYKAAFVWDKIKHNMGHYNSVRHELLLICVRGSCQPDKLKLYDSVQSIERMEHSAKPEKFREIIDDIYPEGKRIELFARKRAEGWDAFGNELS